MESQKCHLPMEVVECIFSFLSIPTMCRMRTVCKEWNQLTRSPTFHTLCGENGKKEDYLFLWRKHNFFPSDPDNTLPKFETTFHFFDFDREQWYFIPSTKVLHTCSCNPNEEALQWVLGMDSGLVCKTVPFHNTMEKITLNLSIFNPIAKTSKKLRSPTFISPPSYTSLVLDLSLVTVVDEVTHNSKVFFFDSLNNKPLAYVLESSMENWQPIGGLTQPMDDKIAFRNTVFASSCKDASLKHCFQLRLFRYEVEGNTFTKVWQMNFQRKLGYSKLVVRHNRLFVLVTTTLPKAILISDSEDESEPESQTCFQTCQDEEGALFEMYEILVDKGSCKPVVQFTEGALEAVWGDDICTNLWFAFPCFDSKGECSSVVLMDHRSREMRRWHLATGTVNVLPACPLSATISAGKDVSSTFFAKTMPLSLRDVLQNGDYAHLLVNAS